MRKGSLRWAFRFGAWSPTEEEWSLAARCVQPEEKQRIARFMFKRDAKSAMVRFLLTRCGHDTSTKRVFNLRAPCLICLKCAELFGNL